MIILTSIKTNLGSSNAPSLHVLLSSGITIHVFEECTKS